MVIEHVNPFTNKVIQNRGEKQKPTRVKTLDQHSDFEMMKSKTAEDAPTVVLENRSTAKSGTTFGTEPLSFGDAAGAAAEGEAELEILKAVISREGYIKRLRKEMRSVRKKFKVEIADLIDFVRAASMSVVEAIVRWREIKKDHSAAFMWNGINYLLKMPSDLDFLHEYRVVRNWIGFDLIRNPLCVPMPLSDGAALFVDKVFDSKHVDDMGVEVEGFLIGNVPSAKLKNKYALAAQNLRPTSPSVQHRYPFDASNMADKPEPGSPSKEALTASAYGFPGTEKKIQIDGGEKTIKLKKAYGYKPGADELPAPTMLMNDEMLAVRQAELVVLKEEERWGRCTRDPEGQVISVAALQAMTSSPSPRVDVEHSEDPVGASSQTSSSKKIPPMPNTLKRSVSPEASRTPLTSNVHERGKDPLQPANPEMLMPLKIRGAAEARGMLTPSEKKDSMQRPAKGAPGKDSESVFSRKKKTLADRLEEIESLRKAVEDEKLALDYAQRAYGYEPKRRRKDKRDKHSQGLFSKSLSSIDRSLSPDKDSLDALHKIDKASMSAKQDFSPAVPLTKDSRQVSFSDERSGAKVPKKGGEGGFMAEASIESKQSPERMDMTIPTSSGKPRLLRPDADLGDGLSYGEDLSVQEIAVLYIQSVARGFVVRCWVRRYKSRAITGSLMLQTYVRGWLTRLRITRLKQENSAATAIQRVYRGGKCREQTYQVALNFAMELCVVRIQRTYRGHRGRQRYQNKILLDETVLEIQKCIDPTMLLSTDVKELAQRIQISVANSMNNPYPPDEVLQLIRLCTMVLQSCSETMGISKLEAGNYRLNIDADGSTMTWRDCAKLLDKSERFLRIVRAMAYAPSAKPPRIVRIPKEVRLLIAAQENNPRWSVDTFEHMGFGSKVCMHLHKWLLEISRIAKFQKDFVALFSASAPKWLPKLYKNRDSWRACELKVLMLQKSVERLRNKKAHTNVEEYYKTIMDREIAKQHTVLRSLVKQKSDLDDALNKLDVEQSNREDAAFAATAERLDTLNEQHAEVKERYLSVKEKAADGDKFAISQLQKSRLEYTLIQIDRSDAEAKYTELSIKCKQDKAMRKVDSHMSPDLCILWSEAGELKANYIFAEANAEIFLKQHGVRDPDSLEDSHFSDYAKLIDEIEQCRALLKKQIDIGEQTRIDYEAEQIKELESLEESENEIESRIIPSDAEMEEDKMVDEALQRQGNGESAPFVPIELLEHITPRPRPVVVALSRDLPQYVSKRIHQQVTALIPGLFVTLDVDRKMGFDVRAMQKVLDARKSIIMYVDIGLTKSSRATFLKTLSKCTKGLVPTPFITLAVGDEQNQRTAYGDPHFGIAKEDIRKMLDGDIKLCLENMGYAMQEMGKLEHGQTLAAYCARLEPPSLPFLVVCEALYALQSEDEVFFNSERIAMPMSWRALKPMMNHLSAFVNTFRNIKRGKASARRADVLSCYTQHHLWPGRTSDCRIEDPLLNAMAYYVEEYTKCEMLTRQRGGAPVHPLTRGSMKGIQTVLQVQDVDPRDPEDILDVSNYQLRWRSSANKLVRACLQDLRTLKTVKHIDSKPYTVGAYREGENIYFDVYDTNTSTIFLTCCPVREINQILAPQASFGGRKGAESEPPVTLSEMYSRLAKNLHIRRTAGMRRNRKDLFLHRDFIFVGNFTAKLNGHFLQLKAFETSMGQLNLVGYMPHFCATIHLTIDDEVRTRLSDNLDMSIESEVRETTNPHKLLPYIIDRLNVYPLRVTTNLLGKDAFMSYKLLHTVPTAARMVSQGFSLKLNCAGGPGKVVKRTLVLYSGIPHVVVLKECTSAELTRCIVYEPRMRVTYEVRVSNYIRRILTIVDSKKQLHMEKHNNPDVSMEWMPSLIHRLKLDWHGAHCLKLDASVYKGVHMICDLRVIFKVEVVDMDSLLLSFFSSTLSQTFSQTVDASLLQSLMDYKIPTMDLSAEVNVNTKVGATVMKIMKNLNDESFTADVEDPALAAKRAERLRMPGEFIKDFVSDKDNIKALISVLQYLLTKVKRARDNFVSVSFEGELPTGEIKFVAEVPPVDSPLHAQMKDARTIDTSLKRNPHVKAHRKVPNEELSMLDYALYVRRQGSVVHMEGELEDMVQMLARRARAIAMLRDKANEDLGKHMDSLSKNTEKTVKINTLVSQVVSEATDDLVSEVENKYEFKVLEKKTPQSTRAQSYAASRLASRAATRRPSEDIPKVFVPIPHADGRSVAQVDYNTLSDEDKAVYSRGEHHVWDGGVKVSFRDTSMRWEGHVSLSAFESCSWDPEVGIGRRIRFVIYDPNSSQKIEGFIRNTKHLREVLGPQAQDLLMDSRISEMIPFIAKHRLFLMTNFEAMQEYTALATDTRKKFLESEGLESVEDCGVDSTIEYGNIGTADEGEAIYHIEFESARLFSIDKVTPVNLGGAADMRANQGRTFELDDKRGNKIGRLVKRVSGLLLQLTVFEVGNPMEDKKNSSRAASPSPADTLDKPSTADSTESKHSPRRGGSSPHRSRRVKVDEDAPETGLAENRKRTKLRMHDAPMLRIVAYDPQSKRKLTMMPPTEAILEVAGGSYSPFLEKARRRELARIVCEALFLIVKGRSTVFEMNIRWSGTMREATATIDSSKKAWRATAESVVKRKGKLFRSAVRISEMELIVTMYAAANPPLLVQKSAREQEVREEEEEEQEDASEEQTPDASPTSSRPASAAALVGDPNCKEVVNQEHGDLGLRMAGDKGGQNQSLVVNFYSMLASEAAEFVITEEEQVERIGRTIFRFAEGTERATAARRLCRYFKATLLEDPEDNVRMILKVELVPVKVGLDGSVSVDTLPGEELRPVGVPECFMPLESCGTFLYSTRKELPNRDMMVDAVTYSINAFTKSKADDASKGLVFKIYEPGKPDTMVMHVGPSALIRICDEAGEFELIRDMIAAIHTRDTARGQNSHRGARKKHPGGDQGESVQAKAERLIQHMIELATAQIGVFDDSVSKSTLPYIIGQAYSY